MIRLSSDEVKARQFITKFFLDRGFAPNVGEIASACQCDQDAAKEQLHSLAQNKALVLHPGTSDVWIAHPFSDAPNAVWVEALDGSVRMNGATGWWSNCPWCAFGIAALAKQEVRIVARLASERESVEIEIKSGKLEPSSLVVHFPIPVPRLWDNVIYSCSMMLLFRSADQVKEWCERHRKPQGAILSLEKVWALAKGWYGPYLDPSWNRKSPEEVQAFFAALGLGLDFRATGIDSV